jgi:diaminopimelate epimerase
MNPRFTKFHGLGNDYLVIEESEISDVADLGGFAGRICNRHYGAGGDGIAIIKKLDNAEADFRCRIFNPDGSEAGLSGNGTRCAVAYLYYTGAWNEPQLRLSTRTGLKTYFLRDKPGPGKYIFESELGQPKFDPPSIPMNVEGINNKVIDFPLVVGDQKVNVTAMQMGNPNCCIFVDNFEEFDWRVLGKSLETDHHFPDRTNVVFIRVIDRTSLELRIWERGVGETSASGTCSCAAAIAAMVNGRTERAVQVSMPGGIVGIKWREDDEVVITASAEVVYTGQWLA